MPKIVNNNGQYKLTLPKELVEYKGWKSGMKVTFVEDVEGNIILKPIGKMKK